jgi:subtilisin family serine protease
MAMKIHPSAMVSMDLAEKSLKNSATLGESPAMKRMFGSMGQAAKHADLKTAELKVDMGLGFKTAESAATIKERTTRRVKTVLASKTFAALDAMKSVGVSSLDGSNAWAQAHATVHQSTDSKQLRGDSSPELCGYSSLRFEDVHGGISLKGLDAVSGSAVSRACMANLVAALAMQPDVLQIVLKPRARLFNDYSKSIIQNGVSSSSSSHHVYNAAGLDGTGQIVAVGDSGVDDLHCAFIDSDGTRARRTVSDSSLSEPNNRKIIQYIQMFSDAGFGRDTDEGHGSHVCGTVAGKNQNSWSYDGHAPGAKISLVDMSDDGESIYYRTPIGDYLFDPTVEAGANIHSNSWGSFLNAYDSDTQDIDAYHVSNDNFLAVFAAGNDGQEGFFSIANPAVSKNALAVGASWKTGSIGDIVFFSSMGPTFDNRFKPDIIAPGYLIDSVRADMSGPTCGSMTMSGTSMATPAVSGNGALIRQYFEDPNFWKATCRASYTKCASAFSPRGATVKAAIIHSGVQMTRYLSRSGAHEETQSIGSTPDILQGFGRMFLQNVLPLSGITPTNFDLFVDETSIDSSGRVTYSVTVTGDEAPLKATLVWMDPPASAISGKQLVNDLDLKIVFPGGSSTEYGNGFAGDEFNNVEQVLIQAPASGTYSVVVTSKSFSTTQKFSLIITSIGSVSTPVTSTVTPTQANFPKDCATGESQVTLFLFDQGSDGWGSSTYSLVGSNSVFERSGALLAPTDGNIFVRETFCLTDGDYNINLNLIGTNPEEVGLQVENCHLSLSSYSPSGSFSISNNACSFCSDNSLDLNLVGSSYGIPYGWHGDSSFVIRNTLTLDEISGTMTVGILDTQSQCIPNGNYNITFDGIPASDDFLNDDLVPFYGGYGIEEYEIQFSCGSDFVELKAFQCNLFRTQCDRIMQVANVNINNGNCDLVYIAGGDTEVEPNSAISRHSVGLTSALVSCILATLMWALYLA